MASEAARFPEVLRPALAQVELCTGDLHVPHVGTGRWGCSCESATRPLQGSSCFCLALTLARPFPRQGVPAPRELGRCLWGHLHKTRTRRCSGQEAF